VITVRKGLFLEETRHLGRYIAWIVDVEWGDIIRKGPKGCICDPCRYPKMGLLCAQLKKNVRRDIVGDDDGTHTKVTQQIRLDGLTQREARIAPLKWSRHKWLATKRW
jgi:hypothetical protein